MGKYSWDDSEELRYKNLIKRVNSTFNTTWYNKIVNRVLANKKRYAAISKELDIPLALIPLIEIKESGSQCGKFTMYIGNGQSLKKRTTKVPRGRGPFKTWEGGVRDAFKVDSLGDIKEWTLSRLLHYMEGYNGWGYRNRGKLSPYLWAFTKPNGIGTGYYIGDGKYSPTAKSKNIGAYAFYMMLIKADKDFIIGSKVIKDESPKNTFNFWQWLSDFIKDLFKPVDKVETKTEDKETIPPWYTYAKQFDGKHETDPKFAAFMVPYWRILGLKLKVIDKNWAAWCGLAQAVILKNTGFKWQKDGALAKNWMKYGVAIDWKRLGIPLGAVVQLNHKGKCGSSKGNHVGVADKNYTAEDLLKKGATLDLFGGNQGDRWKTSTYNAWEICAVRWPEGYPLPGKVLKSGKSGEYNKESTR